MNVLIEMENFLTLLTFLSLHFLLCQCFAFGMAVSKLHPTNFLASSRNSAHFKFYLFIYFSFLLCRTYCKIWIEVTTTRMCTKKGTMSNYPSIDNTLFTRVVLCDYIFFIAFRKKNFSFFLFLSFSLDWHFFTSTIADEMMCHWDSSEHFLWHWSGKLRMSFTSCFVVGCAVGFFFSFLLCSVFMYGWSECKWMLRYYSVKCLMVDAFHIQ